MVLKEKRLTRSESEDLVAGEFTTKPQPRKGTSSLYLANRESVCAIQNRRSTFRLVLKTAV
jgi:hypothetical protein